MFIHSLGSRATDSRRADGDAERLVSVVMHTMAEEVDALPRPLLRQDVAIVSKAGYIQGAETSVACTASP